MMSPAMARKTAKRIDELEKAIERSLTILSQTSLVAENQPNKQQLISKIRQAYKTLEVTQNAS